MTGTGLTGSIDYDGKKRACTTRVEDLADGRLLILEFLAPPNATPLEGTGGPGDSGSGAFIMVEGEYFLAGVGSFGSDFNGDGIENGYGDLDGYARISIAYDWILSTTGIGRTAVQPTSWGRITMRYGF